MKETKKSVFHARSMEDGIVFRSSKFPALSYEARIDQSGKITTETLPTIVSDFKDLGISISIDPEKKRKITGYCKIVICIAAILSIIITKQVSIVMGLMYFSIIALKDLVEFAQSSFDLKLGKYKSTARFHSAEHMVINAYEKKQRIPSMSELKKASRIDKSCGSRKYIDKIVSFGLVSIVISLSPFLKFYVYFMLMIIAITLSILQNKYNIFGFLQIFVTSKPTERELKVALAGIELFDKEEEEIPEECCCPMGMIVMSIEIHDDEEESAEN